MKLRSPKLVFSAMIAAVLLGVLAMPGPAQTVSQIKPTSASSQTTKKSAAPGQAVANKSAARPARQPAASAPGKPVMADQVYSNIQVLKGLTEDQFMDTMAFISVGIGTNCVHCHDRGIADGSAARWKAFAVDTPMKKLGRQMIMMVNRINERDFAGSQAITCFTCHQGSDDAPPVIPQLSLQYAAPLDQEPDQYAKQDPDAPMPTQVLEKYIAAIGGSERIDALKTYVGTGTYSGYDTDFQPDPIKIYHRAPDQQTWTVSLPFGERSRVFNGKMGWNATPDTSQVRAVLPIVGGRVATEKTMARIAFPAEIGQSFTRLITGGSEMINGGEPGNHDLPDREAWVVQGMDSSRLPVKLYFEKQSGLLVRVVTYAITKLGIIPTQIDYSNFREVSGIKMPFHWVVTATDGQNVYDLTDVEINAPIDDSKFALPAPPKLLTPAVKTAENR